MTRAKTGRRGGSYGRSHAIFLAAGLTFLQLRESDPRARAASRSHPIYGIGCAGLSALGRKFGDVFNG